MRITRRAVVAGALAGLAEAALAEAPLRSPRPIPRPAQTGLSVEQMIAAAGLGGQVSFALAELRGGRILEARTPQLVQPPASTLKLITALYALEHLPSDHRFLTRVMATGPIEGGVVRGDLVLAGGGDASLSSDHLATLVRALRAQGVVGVAGDFLVWGGALPFVSAIADDQPIQVGYNPAVSGLNLNFNRLHFGWKRVGSGYDLALEARANALQPRVNSARVQLSERAHPVYAYSQDAGREEWSVARAALGRSGSRFLPVRQPELYAGDVFQTLARAEGLALAAPKLVETLPFGSLLGAHSSDPLQDKLKAMLHFSTNITAETIGMTVSAARGRTGGPNDSGREMHRWLDARSGASDAVFVDHSGLGGGSRISAAAMVRVLTGLGQQRGLKSMLRPFALLDANGREHPAHPVRVDAKTGTLNFISSLAGYLSAPGGVELAFAIFTADPARRAAAGAVEAPAGAADWVRRSKRLQQGLIERWGGLYGA